MARGYEVVSGAAPLWGGALYPWRLEAVSAGEPGVDCTVLLGRAPRVGRDPRARVGHRRQLAGRRQRVHHDLGPARIVIAGLAAEWRDLDLAVAQHLVEERNVHVRRDVALGARRVLLLE